MIKDEEEGFLASISGGRFIGSFALILGCISVMSLG